MKILYKKFAKYYDLIYSYKGKRYKKEVNFIIRKIKKNKIKGKNMLDVGCGTGNHAITLKKRGFSIVGLDLSKEMLKVARKKTKKIRFIQGDMRTFNLKKEFDIILCLFSTMHYNKSYHELEKTIKNFYRHLKTGGIVIFDMGFNKEIFKPGHLHVDKVDLKNISLIRIGKSYRKGDMGKIIFDYVLIKNGKSSFYTDIHYLKIFETLKVKKICEKIGFKIKICDGFKNKTWTKKSKKRVVFVGRK